MGCDIVIGTNGRFLQFINQRCLSLKHIRYVVLDEIDKLLENSADINQIMVHESMPSADNKNVLMFSATMPEKTWATRYLNEFVLLFEENNMGGACHNVIQTFLQTFSNEKHDRLLELLKSSDAISTMVFVNNSKQAENLKKFLMDSGIPCAALHGLLAPEARGQILKDFKRGFCSILVATDIASRGLGIFIFA